MLLKKKDFVELETTFERMGGAARAAAVRELADALVASAGTLGPIELRVYDEVIRWLARRSDSWVRASVAEGVAAAASGPELTVRDLAHDPDPLVAAPVLRGSRLVPDADLMAIARLRGEEHLVAIAGRAGLKEPIAETLAARGSSPVLRILAGNPTAGLSSACLERLAGAARRDRDLTVALLKRPDLPVRLTQSLVRQYASLHDCGDQGLPAETSDDGLDESARSPAESSAPRRLPSSRDLGWAEAQAAALGRHLMLSGDDVGWCLENERWVESLAVIARLTAHPTEQVARAFVERIAGAMLAYLFLAGARWDVAEHALLAWQAADPTRAAALAATYSGLTRQRAERALRAAGLDAPATHGRA